MSNKQLVLDAFNNKAIDRTLTGFWFHFSAPETFVNGTGNDALWQHTLAAHQRYFKEVQPEILKIMSDGYFTLPYLKEIDIRDADALANLQPSAPDAPWFTEQVELCRRLTAEIGDSAATFYTVFSPLTTLLFSTFDRPEFRTTDWFSETVKTAPDALRHALGVLAADLSQLAARVLTDGGVDGLYYSVRNYTGIDADAYRDLVVASDLAVLATANAIKDNQILHICGLAGVRNDLDLYKTYPAKVYNWAVYSEALSLAEGKKFFGGKAVLGGFDNGAAGLLYSGTRQEIEAEVERILAGFDRREGVLLGADCTLPDDIDFERLKWVKTKAAAV